MVSSHCWNSPVSVVGSKRQITVARAFGSTTSFGAASATVVGTTQPWNIART